MGEEQPKTYIERSVYAAVYKDEFSVGFEPLYDDISKWYKNSEHSLRKNQKVLRRIFYCWSKQFIELGTVDNWNKAATNVPLGNQVKKLNLLLDSVDFRLAGKSTTSKGSPDWSYKEDSPAQRYYYFRDLQGFVRALFGGSFPKTYDGHWVQICKEMINEKFLNAHIGIDTHFRICKDYFENITFYCKFNEPNNKKRKRNGKRIQKLTKAQEKFNKQINEIRSRVENLFGIEVRKFDALKKPWWEGKIQQDYFVWFVTGVHNFEKQLKTKKH